jgi:hypothetical protein
VLEQSLIFSGIGSNGERLQRRRILPRLVLLLEPTL